jgi:hypothetical protein
MQKIIYRVTIKNLGNGKIVEIMFPTNAVSANFIKGEIFCSSAMKQQILRGLKNTLNRAEEVAQMNDYDPWVVSELMTKRIAKVMRLITPNCMYEIIGSEEERY